MIRTLVVFLSSISLFLVLVYSLQARLDSPRALSLKSNFRAQVNAVINEEIIEGESLREVRISKDGSCILGVVGDESLSKLVLIEPGQGRRELAQLEGHISNLEISDDGDRAVFLYKEKGAASNRLLFWETGFEVQSLVKRDFQGDWQIHFSGLGNRVLAVSKSPNQKSLRIDLGKRKTLGTEREAAPSGLPKVSVQEVTAANNASIGEVSGSVLTQLAWQKDGTYKKTQTIYKTKVSPYDVDGSGSSDFLIFGPGRELPYFQAYTSSGFDGASKQVAGITGYKANWRFGDNNGVPFTGDFDGDGFEDLGTLTPNFAVERQTEDANWLIYLSGGSSLLDRPAKPTKVMKLNWGFGNVRAIPADYDGDGTTDVGIFHKEAGLWQLLYSSGGFNSARAINKLPGAGLTVFWGQGGIPVPGDFNGDGLADICSYIEGVGEEKSRWQMLLLRDKGQKLGKQREITFGQAGDKAISGDFNCNGKSDIALYRPSEKKWIFRFGQNDIREVKWYPKVTGELKPITGDFDGDSCSDMGFVSIEEDKLVTWHILPSSLAGGVIEVLGELTNTIVHAAFGRPIDRPVSLLLREHQQE